jgi:hypothetical protein
VSESLTARRAARALALQVLFASTTGSPTASSRRRGRGLGRSLRAAGRSDRPAWPPGGRAWSRTGRRRRRWRSTRIVAGSRNWRLERMARVDRNILRLAVGELVHAPATPVRVVINEAVELAKRFGTAESPAFVNGVLDRIASNLGRRDDGPVAEPT